VQPAETPVRPVPDRPPQIALLVLGVVLVVALLLTTPWDPLGVPEAERVAVSPNRDFAAVEQALADEYQRLVRPFSYLGLAVSLGVTMVLGLTSLGARLVSTVGHRLRRGWVVQVLAGGLLLLVVVRVASLPFAARVEAVRMQYGLSTRSWWGWGGDVLRSFALNAGLTLLAVLALVALARTLPKGWWFPAAAGGAALVLVVSFTYPLVVEPVFNRFTPMPEGEIRESLLALAESDGVPVDEVLVADASRRTSTLNAYVSGFGATRRIVVYDTLLDGAPADEVEMVVAHELGHAAERDVLRGTLLGALGIAAAVCLIAVLLQRPSLLRRAGAAGPGDPRVVALVLALVALLSFASGPLENVVSRRVETRADLHALQLTRDPETFASLQRSLALASLADLDPPAVSFALFASHPTAPMRIAFARTWAEESGAPPVQDLAPVAGSPR
jgi:STE24 endopeptidase